MKPVNQPRPEILTFDPPPDGAPITLPWLADVLDMIAGFERSVPLARQANVLRELQEHDERARAWRLAAEAKAKAAKEASP